MKTSKNKITYKEQINHYSKIIKQNFALFEFYKNNYELFVKKLNKLGISNPKVIELGSGPSFLKEFYLKPFRILSGRPSSLFISPMLGNKFVVWYVYHVFIGFCHPCFI